MRAPGDELDRWPLLPPESPLPMPMQSFTTGSCVPGPFPSTPRGMALRRAWILGGTALLTLSATAVFFQVLAAGGVTVLEAVLAGAVRRPVRVDRAEFRQRLRRFPAQLQQAQAAPAAGQRLWPAAPATRAYRAAHADLQRGPAPPDDRSAGDLRIGRGTGQLPHFDFFILSDTTRRRIARPPKSPAFQQLRERTGGHARLFYRRRDDNRERKAGNISEWVRRFGGAIRYMLILDADSLMTGEPSCAWPTAIERIPMSA